MIPQLKNTISYFDKLFFSKIDVDFWIAGGALRDYFLYGKVLPGTDYDFYFNNKDDWSKVKKYFTENGYVKKYETENSYKVIKNNTEIDLVKLFYYNPKQTISSFDFTICCCSVSKYAIYHHETFFIDLAQKNIVLNNYNNPINSLIRIKKYMKKGFNIDNYNYLKLIKKSIECPEEKIPQIIKSIPEDIVVINNQEANNYGINQTTRQSTRQLRNFIINNQEITTDYSE